MSRLRSAIVSLALVAVFLLAIEAAARIFETPTRLGRILDLLERDEDLLWRLRAGLDIEFEHARLQTNEHHLRGPSFADQKPAGVRRIVCLGASPTFGWGVPYNSTFPALLQDRLRAAGSAVEIINAGVPGYSSWQGLGFLKRNVLSWAPDLVTVAYDLNDIDRFRFFMNNGRPDADQTPSSAASVETQNALNRLASYRLFRRGIFAATGARSDLDVGRMPQRVPVPHYRENLAAVAGMCRESGIRVVFLKMPFHFPFERLRVVDADAARRERVHAEAAYARGDDEGAARRYEAALSLDPTMLDAYPPFITALERSGRADRAAEIRNTLPFLHAFQKREDLLYNRAVADVAAEVGAPLLDMVAAFERDGRGDGLWNSAEDPFHPNAEGHGIIAEGLAPIVERELDTIGR